MFYSDAAVLKELKDRGCDILYIPGGCTGILQVMDVHINAIFKRHVKAHYVSWRARQIQVRPL